MKAECQPSPRRSQASVSVLYNAAQSNTSKALSLHYSPRAFHTPTSPSSPPATTTSPSQSMANSLSPKTLPRSFDLRPSSPCFGVFRAENKACLGDRTSHI